VNGTPVVARFERIAIAVFALARTLLCAYRAAHQSITVDEATTYLNYVRGPWSNVWGPYDPNNHVLFSILARISVHLFHISELTLRLPTVIAGFFLVLGFYRVLELTVESRAIRCLATVTVSLAPLLLDFSVAARGYGLGITLLVWAAYFAIRGRDFWAGIFSGLAMAATFNLAFAVLGIVACPLALGAGRWRARLRRVNRIFEPAAIVLLAICFPEIRQAQGWQFYIGTPHLSEALYDFVRYTVLAWPRHRGWLGSEAALGGVEFFLLPAMLALILVTAIFGLRREPGHRRFLVPALALLLFLVAVAASHLLGINYPEDRLTLPAFVFLALAWAIAVARLPNRALRMGNGAVALVLMGQFLSQFHVSYFTVWQFDAGIRTVARRLRDDLRGQPPRSVSLSATSFHRPALEYYRNVYNIGALQPIERNEPTKLEGYDYYVLNGDDRGRMTAKSGPPLFYDERSGVELFK
jgi:hypothetical protein